MVRERTLVPEEDLDMEAPTPTVTKTDFQLSLSKDMLREETLVLKGDLDMEAPTVHCSDGDGYEKHKVGRPGGEVETRR